MTDKTMHCPVCGSELERSKDTRIYETLIDHVELREPYARHYWTCPNVICEVQKYGAFWDEFGAPYLGGKDAYQFYMTHRQLRAS